ncbi:hypothetical protein ACFFJY_03390 [Fictibacillus aquaticus]|uniref:Uncharacterized protein n=1 Tax=Fictibacillus aquaticus TaxID=2021314 RepID=A0A235F8U8_9BACL|nr:hypothetical protein [Fictibacillus aquaticus]OYD57740.1 hypothetical protein CGZ90_13860 [Fictibacillus aquaticus]
MKKFIKWGLISLAVILVAAGGYAYYIFNIKTYDTADKEVDKIVKTAYEIKLPKLDGNLSSEDPAETAAPGEEKSKDNSKNTAKTASSTTQTAESGSESKPKSDQTGKNGSSSQPAPKAALTAESIKSQYRPSFESLQSQANSKLSALMGHAKAEYSQKVANGETISVGYFAQKYKGAAANLESATNSAFNTIYSSLQADLRRYGFSASEAQEFKTHYENEKNARRSELLAQITGR